jgi:hypothetical protein
MTSNSNFKVFKSIVGNNLNSMHTIIHTYDMDTLKSWKSYLGDSTTRMGQQIHNRHNSNHLDYANDYKPKRVKTYIGNLDLTEQ